MIAFSIDTDWAPEEVIADTLRLFEESQVKCTLFCTSKSEVIDKCDRNLFEIAIHPNFNQILDGSRTGSYKNIIDNLLEIYPEAKGMRCHSLTQSSHILAYACESGIIYDSNLLIPYANYLRPFKYWYNMIRVPYNFIDDAHWLYGNSFNDCHLELDNDSVLNVLDFHPIHVFLNTEKENTYLKAKVHYQSSEMLVKFRNNSTVKGARDLLIELLKQASKNNLPSFKMIEIAKLYL